jgi:TonB family protein
MERWIAAQRKGTGPMGVVLSVVVHATIIGVSVYETSRPPGAPEELHPMALVRFLAPPNRETGQAYQPEMVRYVSIAVPEGLIRAPVTTPVPTEAPAPAIALGSDLFDAPETPALSGLDSVYSIIDVDSAASRYEWSAAPVFPPTMLAQGIAGFVRAQWVVDTAGVPDTASLKIIESTHPEFEKAVRDALPFMRFRPAKIGAQYVRQLVEQPFNFRINRPAPPDTTVPPRA